MKHTHTEPVPELFSWARGDPPKNDAAPSGNGAGVKVKNSSPNSTLAKLPLMPPAHHNAPPGSSDVAARMIAGYAARQRADVLAVIAQAGAYGATDAEIQAALGCCPHSVSPRRGELRALGLIADSGVRRPTPRGRPATVWVLMEYAPSPPAFEPGESEHSHRAEGGAR